MLKLENLKNINDEILKCTRCGTCRVICPVFKETGQETMVARGRLKIVESILKGKLDFSDKALEIINSCLLCGSCTDVCANKVNVEKIIAMARRDNVKKNGLSLAQEFVFRYMLENRTIFGTAVDSAFYLQKIFTQSTSKDHLRHLPFFLLGLEKGRLLPKLAKERLSEIYPKINSPKNRKLRVGFFSGCLFEYVYTNIGKSIIEILLKNNIEVVFPKNQKCCGTPALSYGDEQSAKKLASNNVKAFIQEDLDFIVVGCASCGSALKNYKNLLSGSDLDVEKFSNKVKDISEFLVEYTQINQKISSNIKVTYHDPCHLRRKQKIFNEPRQILKSIENLNFIEMENADQCCGAGGGYSLTHYEISDKIRKRKIESINKTEANYVATSCPGCIMHIEDGLMQKKSPIKVVHVAELLNNL